MTTKKATPCKMGDLAVGEGFFCYIDDLDVNFIKVSGSDEREGNCMALRLHDRTVINVTSKLKVWRRTIRILVEI